MNNLVKDFLKDDTFIMYILGGADESASRWDDWIQRHPECAYNVNKAREILCASPDVDVDFDESEKSVLRQTIFNELGI